SIWRNAFNLVYPTMDHLTYRFELTETIDVPVKSLVVIAAALAMLWVLHVIVNRTTIGTAIRAVAEDQAAASLMGIDVNRIISLTFLIGGAMGGAAGVLFGVQYGLIGVSAWAVAVFPRSVLVFLLFQGSLLFAYVARIPSWLRVTLLGLALLVLMPTIGFFNGYYLEVATQVGIFVALALGLNIVVGLAGL